MQEGTGASDRALGVASEGQYVYVAGHTSGAFQPGSGPPSETPDIFVAQFSKQGEVNWIRQLSTPSPDSALCVAADQNDNVVIGGYVKSSVDGQVYNDLDDFFITMYNSTGHKLWGRQSGTLLDDRFEGIAMDSRGNVIAAGYIGRNATATGDSLDSALGGSGADMVVVKFDAHGTRLWLVQNGTTAEDVARDVAVDTADAVIIAGYTTGNFGGSNGGNNNRDIVVVKYNADGVWQWTQQLGTPGSEHANAVATDSENSIYVAGVTGVDEALDGNVARGDTDMFLVKFSEAGVKQWTRQWGSAGLDEARGISTDSGRNVYVAGWTTGDIDGFVNRGQGDMVLTKFDGNGNKQWTRHAGSREGELATGAAVDSEGSIYMAGYTRGNLSGGYLRGSEDMVLLKFGIPHT